MPGSKLPKILGKDSAKAWINFNGTGTVAINASENMSMPTDNGTGDYTLNFLTAIPDADYVVFGSGWISAAFADNNHGTLAPKRNVSPTTTQCRIGMTTTNGTTSDFEIISVGIIR